MLQLRESLGCWQPQDYPAGPGTVDIQAEVQELLGNSVTRPVSRPLPCYSTSTCEWVLGAELVLEVLPSSSNAA